MKSVVDVEIGKIEEFPEFIVIPIWLQASDDDSDDESMPVLQSGSLRLAIAFDSLQGTQEEVSNRIKNFIREHYRTSMAGSGFDKLIEGIDKFLAKNDVSVYGKKYIPTPASSTRH